VQHRGQTYTCFYSCECNCLLGYGALEQKPLPPKYIPYDVHQGCDHLIVVVLVVCAKPHVII
jgi:hypothetical protein